MPERSSSRLADFIRESNRIEGIYRAPTRAEIAATQTFLDLPTLTIADVAGLVTVYQPGAILRDQPGLNVRVGNYVAPPGGPEIPIALKTLLGRINAGPILPWEAHVAYETLHPFTDGNGRSGRAIWLWQHLGVSPLGFLHEFYYETLSCIRRGHA
jgi:hypothetical protein